MSLFDVIKYPISDPPTRAEIEALPKGLIAGFLCRAGWSHEYISRVGLYRVVTPYTEGRHREDIKILRQMIKDY